MARSRTGSLDRSALPGSDRNNGVGTPRSGNQAGRGTVVVVDVVVVVVDVVVDVVAAAGTEVVVLVVLVEIVVVDTPVTVVVVTVAPPTTLKTVSFFCGGFALCLALVIAVVAGHRAHRRGAIG